MKTERQIRAQRVVSFIFIEIRRQMVRTGLVGKDLKQLSASAIKWRDSIAEGTP